MTITTTTLTRAAGLAAVAGGLLFIAVQVKHPHLDATFATTTEYAVRETMKIFMAVLSLVGITGIYLRQVRQIGVLGLVGYLFLSRRLPHHAERPGHRRVRPARPCGQSPGYVNDVLAVATSGTPVGDVGRVQTLSHGRRRLHRRRPDLRHRPLPGRHPRPVGRSAPLRRRRRDHRHLRCCRWSTSGCSPFPSASP